MSTQVLAAYLSACGTEAEGRGANDLQVCDYPKSTRRLSLNMICDYSRSRRRLISLCAYHQHPTAYHLSRQPVASQWPARQSELQPDDDDKRLRGLEA